jgi:hypothetical protein
MVLRRFPRGPPPLWARANKHAHTTHTSLYNWGIQVNHVIRAIHIHVFANLQLHFSVMTGTNILPGVTVETAAHEHWVTHSFPDSLSHFVSVTSFPTSLPCPVLPQCVLHFTRHTYTRGYSGIQHRKYVKISVSIWLLTPCFINWQTLNPLSAQGSKHTSECFYI